MTPEILLPLLSGALSDSARILQFLLRGRVSSLGTVPRTPRQVRQIPQLLCTLGFACLHSGCFAAPSYLHLCVFFCPRSHSELCSELLPLARSTARAGSLLQLTWCLPQIQQFKLKLALAFKVSSNSFNSSALCEKQMGNIKTYISSCNSQSEWESCKKFTVRRRTVCKLSLCSKTVYYQRIILGDSCCWGILCLFFFFKLLLHFSHTA